MAYVLIPSVASGPCSREARVLGNLDRVRSAAKNLYWRVPHNVTMDDLVSAGTIGLINAVDRFDESRGLAFSTYARHRIVGAMLDFLRAEDPLSRTERRRCREATAEAPFFTRSGAPVTLSLDQIPAGALNAACMTTKHTPLAQAMRAELKAARRRLLPNENRVLSLLYDLGMKGREAALELGVNERHVSEIKRKALAKLRTRFRPANGQLRRTVSETAMSEIATAGT
jgi:RNA polymerase sigma factor for flagellar operon FliA